MFGALGFESKARGPSGTDAHRGLWAGCNAYRCKLAITAGLCTMGESDPGSVSRVTDADPAVIVD